MKYAHTSINSPDWRRLSRFYQKVFGCVPVPPERDLYGDFFERVTGLPDAHVRGEHIRLPGYGEDGPTLEIFTYTTSTGEPAPINGRGFSHIAFEVMNVNATFEELLRQGGSACGELITTYYASKGLYLTMVYAQDPDGNVVEIQKWHESPEG